MRLDAGTAAGARLGTKTERAGRLGRSPASSCEASWSQKSSVGRHRQPLEGRAHDAVRRHDPSSVSQVLPGDAAQRGAGPVKPGGHGAWGHAQDLGRFAVVEALAVHEHHGDALVDRQLGQGAAHGLRGADHPAPGPGRLDTGSTGSSPVESGVRLRLRSSSMQAL